MSYKSGTSSSLKSDWTTLKCPLELIGRNSAIPCKIPSKIDCKIVIIPPENYSPSQFMNKVVQISAGVFSASESPCNPLLKR